MIFPSRKLSKLPQGGINAKLATANLSHTNTGLMYMIMNCVASVRISSLYIIVNVMRSSYNEWFLGNSIME